MLGGLTEPGDDVEAVPRPTVRVLLIDPEDRVLLVRSLDEQGLGFWFPPGGGVDAGESLEDAAVRELAVETGLHVASAWQAVRTSSPCRAVGRRVGRRPREPATRSRNSPERLVPANLADVDRRAPRERRPGRALAAGRLTSRHGPGWGMLAR
jgi:8-oxo-dGTP pyrophosphatase MutT (NUDIX family)